MSKLSVLPGVVKPMGDLYHDATLSWNCLLTHMFPTGLKAPGPVETVSFCFTVVTECLDTVDPQ